MFLGWFSLTAGRHATGSEGTAHQPQRERVWKRLNECGGPGSVSLLSLPTALLCVTPAALSLASGWGVLETTGAATGPQNC